MDIRKERVFVANLNLLPGCDEEKPKVVKEEIVIAFNCGDQKRYVPITFINNALQYWGVKLSMRDGYSNHPKALSTDKPMHYYGCAKVLFVSDLKPMFEMEEANEKISIKDLRAMQSDMNKNGAIKNQNWNRGYKYKDTLVDKTK